MLRRFKKRLLTEKEKPFAPTGAAMDSLSLGEIRGELERIAGSVLHKAGIDPTCVSVNVEHVGTTPDRRPVLRTMIDLVRWEPTSAVRLLLGLAHIERGMRRTVTSSWVGEGCQFAGVWLHPADAALETSSLRYLASALGSCDKAFTATDSSTWAPSTSPDAYAQTMPSRLGYPGDD